MRILIVLCDSKNWLVTEGHKLNVCENATTDSGVHDAIRARV
jgi:hypothetical protein